MDAAGLTVAAGYVELHLHTNFSLLEGASHPEELVTRAAELGHTHLELMEHRGPFRSGFVATYRL